MTATPDNPSVPVSAPGRTSDQSDRPLRIRVRLPEAGTALVEVSGTLALDHDADFAAVLANRLDGRAAFLVLDLTSVTFLDTAAAVTMLDAATRAQANGTRLQIVSNGTVDQMLALIGITERFNYTAAPVGEAAATGEIPHQDASLAAERHH